MGMICAVIPRRCEMELRGARNCAQLVPALNTPMPCKADFGYASAALAAVDASLIAWAEQRY